MGFILEEIGSLLTHVFIVPTIGILLRFPEKYYIFLWIILVMNLNSLLYHGCALVEGGFCLYELKSHQLLDHITAEGTILMVAILFIRDPSENLAKSRSIFLFSLWFLSVMKSVYDTPGYLVAILVCLSPLFLRNFLKARRLLLFLIFLSGVLGFSMYFTVKYYHITHPLWHTFIFIALFLAICAKETKAEVEPILPRVKEKNGMFWY